MLLFPYLGLPPLVDMLLGFFQSPIMSLVDWLIGLLVEWLIRKTFSYLTIQPINLSTRFEKDSGP